jgi:geranylgeranyl pyrophosphate synthase
LDTDNFFKEKVDLLNKTIEKYIPRFFSDTSILFSVKKPRYKFNLEPLNKAISEPIWEFLDRGGKRWRPIIFLLICEALGVKSETFIDFAIIPEVIHNGTLIIDDIEDSSKLRRGKTCTYRIYGLDVAINAGNAMYFFSLLPLITHKEKLSLKKLCSLYEIYIQEMINLSIGQGMDISWAKGLVNSEKIDELDYLQMCAYKTGTLARMSAKFAAVLANGTEEIIEKLGNFAESIGVAFQIQDDILDIIGRNFAEKKGGYGLDITEGKRTLIVLHTLKKANASDKKRLIKILKMHTSNKKLIDEAISLIQKYNSIKYTKTLAIKLVKESWKEVDILLPPSEAKNKLYSLTKFLIERAI